MHQSGRLQFAQLQDQHPLADTGHRAPQLTEAQRAVL
jgi:hypothetical protein